MSMWIAGTTLFVGAGTSILGGEKQEKLNNANNAANLAAKEKSDAENLRRWMLTRGIGDNGAPVNTKLPLWATVSRSPGGKMRVSRALPSGIPTVPGTLTGGRSWAALGL